MTPVLFSNRYRYRSKPEIVHDILAALPSNRSRIMYKAYLSFAELKDYLQELERSELIDYIVEENRRQYVLTQRGKHFLEIFRRVKELADGKGAIEQ
jgi:predicted transcriptional regulator